MRWLEPIAGGLRIRQSSMHCSNGDKDLHRKSDAHAERVQRVAELTEGKWVARSKRMMGKS
jgi:hypothetical protein